MLRWSSSRPYGSGTNLGMEDSSIPLPIGPTYTETKTVIQKQLKLWLHSKIHFQWLVSELGNSDIHIMITVQLIGGKGVLETV